MCINVLMYIIFNQKQNKTTKIKKYIYYEPEREEGKTLSKNTQTQIIKEVSFKRFFRQQHFKKIS